MYEDFDADFGYDPYEPSPYNGDDTSDEDFWMDGEDEDFGFDDEPQWFDEE